jgi:hypothetical protein
MFSSNLTTRVLSFVVALRNDTEQQQRSQPLYVSVIRDPKVPVPLQHQKPYEIFTGGKNIGHYKNCLKSNDVKTVSKVHRSLKS